MTDAELTARLRGNILDFKLLQARHGPLRMRELPGVRAFALPSPLANVFQQQVLYENPQALAESLAPLEAWYRELGVPAWRVPVLPPGDPAAEAVLRHAGHRAEDAITGMGLPLTHPLAPRLPPGITLEHPDDLDAVLELNGLAYGRDNVGAYTGWRTGPLPSTHLHAVVVREAGRALACGVSFEQGDTAGIYLVATHPDARRRGLGALVMHGLHADAHARGRSVAVLQASVMGLGLYQRLGYRDLGGWTNWVRRAG
ncbi:MAG TPA: GNAT family N-acetyltransferase [Archangium sp.]|jgi:GNAT superfamily N-acetyltransferase|uniref:GNAT family N-acetyltransferase n=1 Tax=Archangium sp. TaxID=1872627 RepID=UPI002ED9AA87